MTTVPGPAQVIDCIGGYPMPAWVKEFRPQQWETVMRVVDAFQRGKKYVMLDGPTGSGKTLIAEAVRRVLKQKAIYLCTTKTLQDQFVKDFSYAALLKGRSNYPTLDYPEKFNSSFSSLSAGDCDMKKVPAKKVEGKWERAYGEDEDDDDNTSIGGTSEQYTEQEVWECPWCSNVFDCPYSVAKKRALSSSLSCTNLAYFLAECNGPRKFSGKFPLVICDEADLLESAIMGFVELELSSRSRKELKIGAPSVRTHTAKSALESWRTYLGMAESTISDELVKITRECEKAHPPNVRLIRRKKSLALLLDKTVKVKTQILSGGWVYTGFRSGADESDTSVTFKPIWATEHTPEVLWRHGQRFLLMSATMLSGDLTAQELGMEEGSYEMISLGSTFPKENRPVYITPKYNLTSKTKEDEMAKVVASIDAIIDRYPAERILVHTVSYDLTRNIYAGSKHKARMIVYESAKFRDEALEKYRKTEGAIILAPSFERGVDLPDEECRVVIVAKVPYPYLGDKQVSARLYSKGGQSWYHMQTIRAIVQMTGRGVRNDKDWADNYILDSQFMELWRKRKNWFPKWWQEAIIWRDKGAF